MPDPFTLTTADPRFDPREPIVVNGYLFVPASGARRVNILQPRSPKTVVEVKRRKMVTHNGT